MASPTDRTSNLDIMGLDDVALKLIFKRLPLVDMCTVAGICKRFENICFDIWHTDESYTNLIENKDMKINELPTFFLIKMGKFLQSMLVYTRDFRMLNVMGDTLEFEMLTEIHMLNNIEKASWGPAFFLKNCPSLQTLTVCETLARPYLSEILELPALKTLKICHDGSDEDFDNLIAMIIEEKGIYMNRLSTPVDVFPPSWLSDDFMSYFDAMHNLTIDTRQCHYILNEDDYHSLPFLVHLKVLKIIGNSFCEKHLMRLLQNSAELETFYYDPSCVDEWFRCKMVRERQSDGIFINMIINTPANAPEAFQVEENVSIIQFT